MIKQGFILFLVIGLALSCNSSKIGKQDLLTENQTLKNRISELETVDTLKTKAIVEVNKMNVVYRGLYNPLTLSMPETVSFEASAPGLKKIDAFGNYVMYPKTGKTVDIVMKGTLPNRETISDTKTLRIIDIGRPIGTINELGCGKKCVIELTKKEFFEAEIDVKFENFIHDYDLRIKTFKIKIKDKHSIIIEENKMNNRAKDYIKNIKIGDLISLYDIKVTYGSPFSYFKIKRPSPIQIKIIE